MGNVIISFSRIVKSEPRAAGQSSNTVGQSIVNIFLNDDSSQTPLALGFNPPFNSVISLPTPAGGVIYYNPNLYNTNPPTIPYVITPVYNTTPRTSGLEFLIPEKGIYYVQLNLIAENIATFSPSGSQQYSNIYICVTENNTGAAIEYSLPHNASGMQNPPPFPGVWNSPGPSAPGTATDSNRPFIYNTGLKPQALSKKVYQTEQELYDNNPLENTSSIIINLEKKCYISFWILCDQGQTITIDSGTSVNIYKIAQ
jgi:hypothetical protein